jgi:hypothetical protein
MLTGLFSSLLSSFLPLLIQMIITVLFGGSGSNS